MNAPLKNANVTLEDKYRVQKGWVYLTGNNALARLPMQQHLRDKANGINTGGFISGYRGSPLGRYDMELWGAKKLLDEHNIKFLPGVNEDLAVTSVWGSQYVGSFPGAKVDGVFGVWYGKGPGTDRAGDAFRHVGVMGTSKFGGAIALAGDDHGCKSSSIYNFSDQIFIAAGMPVLYPSNTQELLDFGLHGFAMSRFTGCWVGVKVHNDVVEGGGSVYVAPDLPKITLPEVSPAPHLGPAGFNLRIADMPLLAEERLFHHKLPAALAYCRANQLNHTVHDGANARVGVLSAGKSYQDVLQAMSELHLSEGKIRELGLRVGKIGMVWPLEPEYIKEFSQGLEIILVVEEKRPIIEDQLKTILYDVPMATRPRIIGKYECATQFAADRGAPVLQNWGELSPPVIAKVLIDLLLKGNPDCGLVPINFPPSKLPPGVANPLAPQRNPSFCSGCPHNRSTKVPDGSRAMVGIGCHAMAVFNDPMKTPPTFTQMGAEGMHWVGQAAFTHEKHVFANMGDGTYFHSGFLAIRQALAAKVPMTYKILVNGFVSMTGGQPIDGELSVHQIVTELTAEGVNMITVVVDDLSKHRPGSMPHGVPVVHRTEMDAVMKSCKEFPGLSVIVYDQPCATERRRLRKRGKWFDPPKRTFINSAVCEGCGDCGKASNCMSIEPLETPFGRKRKINQSSCNKDFSCVEGFCPSFVTVHGGTLKKPAKSGGVAEFVTPLPEPTVLTLSKEFSILITGIGGTGVVTVGQVLGMAAHIDGLASSVLDVTGLAQKYGAVMSHVRIAPDASHLHATRIAYGEADTVVGCDLVVTSGDEGVMRITPGRTHVVVASDLVTTSDFARNPDWAMDAKVLLERIRERAGDNLFAVGGLRIAAQLMGDSIAANMFMVGAAWQRGRIPLSHAAIMKAIELNKTQIDFNKQSFLWGRRAAVDLAAVEKAATPAAVIQFAPRMTDTLDDIIQRSMVFLTEYQDAAYAQRYKALVDKVAVAEKATGLGDALAKAVARYYLKMLAIKDEFEVARLYTSEAFKKELEATFEGDYELHFHVGQWPFGGVDGNGKHYKKEVGPWLIKTFEFLAKRKHWRGTRLDIYRNGHERQAAYALLAQYEQDITTLVANLRVDNYDAALKLASLPEKIRGYGHVRAQHAATVVTERHALLAEVTMAT
jgi:indolepyruvate ferredoxin oxidoreductase